MNNAQTKLQILSREFWSPLREVSYMSRSINVWLIKVKGNGFWTIARGRALSHSYNKNSGNKSR